MLYVGLDYHTKRSYVSILTEEGDEIFKGDVESQTELVGLLGDLPDGCRVLFEAGYGWPRLARILAGLEIELRMCQPDHNRRIATDRRKSDCRDARNLAVYLKANAYKEAWMPDASVRDERQLIRQRISLQRSTAGIKVRIHSILAYAGVPKEGRDIFAVKHRDYLESVKLDELTRRTVDALLAVYDEMRGKVKELGVLIRELNKADRRARLLKTIPGIGDIAARVLLAEIGDVRRFHSEKALACYTGLTPGQRQSGDILRMTGLTKEGNSNMRWVLVQAGWVAVRRDPALREIFEELEKEKGSGVAICAIARRLAEISWKVLTHEVPYKARKPKGGGQPVVPLGKPGAVTMPVPPKASPKT
jgi:transposase